MKYAIAISMYDKFEQAAILTNILRTEFNSEFRIVVASPHSEAEQRLNAVGAKFDEFVDTSSIDYEPDMGDRGGINLKSRIFYSLCKSCEAAIRPSDVSEVMHLHSDAWPLKERKILELFRKLERSQKKKAAVRGHGLDWRTSNCPIGQAMDQFFVIDADYAREESIFEANPLNYLPHYSVHTMMMLFFLQIGLDRITWYSKMKEDRQWDGSPVNLPYTGVRPGIYNPKWEFLHIATDEFPRQWCKEVQANFLAEINWKCEKLNQYVENYRDPEVFDKIESYESNLNFRMRLRGYIPERWGREFQTMSSEISESGTKKYAKNWLKRLFRDPLFILLGKSRISKFQKLDNPHLWRFYSDAEWPRDGVIDEYKSMRREEFPENCKFWFNDFYSFVSRNEEL